MKRALHAIAFFLGGLLVTWSGLWIGSRIDYRLPISPPHLITSDCPEIDVCAQPWWVFVLLLLHFFGPSGAWSIAGWRKAGVLDRPVEYARLIAILSCTTFAYYVIGYLMPR